MCISVSLFLSFFFDAGIFATNFWDMLRCLPTRALRDFPRKLDWLPLGLRTTTSNVSRRYGSHPNSICKWQQTQPKSHQAEYEHEDLNEVQLFLCSVIKWMSETIHVYINPMDKVGRQRMSSVFQPAHTIGATKSQYDYMDTNDNYANQSRSLFRQ